MSIQETIRKLAQKYSKRLKKRTDLRVEEMKRDDKSHFLIYHVLGISNEEGELIDIYQNKGRFLYKYAGSFLEEIVFLCFKEKFSQAQKCQIKNTLGKRPKQFGIDCLIEENALEIKWRDATTDGNHITKEHTRIQAIKKAGYKPIRVMFYYPNREQSRRIQETLKTIYQGVSGEYYAGDDAWEYIYKQTGIDLKAILAEIAEENLKRRV